MRIFRETSVDLRAIREYKHTHFRKQYLLKKNKRAKIVHSESHGESLEEFQQRHEYSIKEVKKQKSGKV